MLFILFKRGVLSTPKCLRARLRACPGARRGRVWGHAGASLGARRGESRGTPGARLEVSLGARLRAHLGARLRARPKEGELQPISFSASVASRRRLRGIGEPKPNF